MACGTKKKASATPKKSTKKCGTKKKGGCK